MKNTYIPPEASIVKIAHAIRDSSRGLWNFGEEYSLLNAQVSFNYKALSRAVKEQHNVDLYPPSVATKLRKAYEKFVVECEVPLSIMVKFSPYYMYELSTATDIHKGNVNYWINQATTKPRDVLLAEIRDGGDGKEKEAIAMIRVPENVYARIQEARTHLGHAVGMPNLSTTVFMEFITELVSNTQAGQLRRLWDVMHGDAEEE